MIYIYIYMYIYIYIPSLNFCFFMGIKFNARNIVFNQRPFIIN